MLSKYLLAVAFAGAATAVTPDGFLPASKSELVVAFGNTLALNGKSMSKAETAQVPTIGTTQRLTGSYTVMMVDPDIPPQTPGGPTGQLLHWMQQGLTSSNTATMIGGMMVFVLSNKNNDTAFAPYFGPSPPNKAPNTHRYTQLLLDTTLNSSAPEFLLKQAAATRLNFNAVNVVEIAGVQVLAGNSFNVTNGTATATTTNGTSSVPAPAAAAPINSATLQPSNITKLNPNAQRPAGGAASGMNPSPSSNSSQTSGGATNGTDTTAANGTATSGSATNGTAPAPATTSSTSDFGQRGTGAYVAGLLALTAALFLL
ncbi:hypothetical protein VTL71DRAFT_15753 [Oculimacula yallundae]|uniref:PEBP-like protein n=1 Tax=Oculimacula yallundae TaxID=86028 RepID=A0ABR4CCK5_9HELO